MTPSLLGDLLLLPVRYALELAALLYLGRRLLGEARAKTQS